MNWDFASNIVAIVYFLIVILFSTFVWLQLRQQTKLLRASNFQYLLNLSSLTKIEVMKDREIAKLWVEGAKNFHGYDSIDKYRFRTLLVWWLSLHENIYYQWHHGLLDKEIYVGWEKDLIYFSFVQDLSIHWVEIRYNFQNDFCKHVDRIIQTQTSKIQSSESEKIMDLSKKFYISKSPVHEKGLFTSVNIEPGQKIFRVTGEIIRRPYSEEFSKEGSNWIGVGENEWLSLRADDSAIFLNHSCNPNIIISDNMQVIAIKHILAKHELFLDYSTTEVDPFWKMTCHCKSKNCRKTIRAFQFLPQSIQKEYIPYMPERLIQICYHQNRIENRP